MPLLKSISFDFSVLKGLQNSIILSFDYILSCDSQEFAFYCLDLNRGSPLSIQTNGLSKCLVLQLSI